MGEEKPVKYKKEYVEALRRLNALKGLKITESDIGKLTKWEQISAVATLDESNNLTVGYLDIVRAVQKEFDRNFKLKALHILNERTGRNIPDEYVEEIQKAYNFPGAKSHNELIDVHNMFVDIKEELRNKAKMKKMGRLIPEGYEVCGRCGGTGRYSWNPRTLDQCFNCLGSGAVPIKKKEGKGWHGEPKRHSEVQIKNEFKTTLRQPILVPMYGWKQESEKVWKGNGNNEIRIKNTKKGISIEVSTEYGHESDRVNTIEEATESVNWFMKRRPQEKREG